MEITEMTGQLPRGILRRFCVVSDSGNPVVVRQAEVSEQSQKMKLLERIRQCYHRIRGNCPGPCHHYEAWLKENPLIGQPLGDKPPCPSCGDTIGVCECV